MGECRCLWLLCGVGCLWGIDVEGVSVCACGGGGGGGGGSYVHIYVGV